MLWPSEAEQRRAVNGKNCERKRERVEREERGRGKKIRLMERRRRGGEKRGELQSYKATKLRDDLI